MTARRKIKGPKVGFWSDAYLRILPKSEIIQRELPLRWHAEFQQELTVSSTFCGTFSIPLGFVTDGATIPKFFWNTLSDTDPNILYPSFAHDFGYSVHGCLPDHTVTKDQVDQMLRELMRLYGAPEWQCNAVYEAVHLFGHNHFIAGLVGIKQAWSDTTNPQKLAMTAYAARPQVRTP